jgi:hypothetical protein
MADATVQAELEQAWQDSNPNAPDVHVDDRDADGNPSQKAEQGGWIVYDEATDSYRVIRVPSGRPASLPTIVGTRPEGDDLGPSETLVAWFHTHPNSAAEGYREDATPSQGDIDFTNNYARVPGLIVDHGTDPGDYGTIPYP